MAEQVQVNLQRLAQMGLSEDPNQFRMDRLAGYPPGVGYRQPVLRGARIAARKCNFAGGKRSRTGDAGQMRRLSGVA